MKRTLATFTILLGLATAVSAQQEELKSAQANITGKKYIAALDDLNKAKKAVTKLIADELGSVIPAKFGEFEVQGDEDMGGMNPQGASVNRVFKKPTPKQETAGTDGQPGEAHDGDMGMEAGAMDPMGMMGGQQEEIVVRITTNMMMATEVMNAHSMSEENMGMDSGKPVRVKGYRALLRTYGGEDSPEGMGQPLNEQAMAVVGGAYVHVEARGLKEKGQAEKLLNLIDFDKLKGIVGE